MRKTDLLKTLNSENCKKIGSRFLRSSNSQRYHWILKLLVATLKSELWEQKHVWLFYYFSFESNYDVLKSKSPCLLLNKNVNFDKNETKSKMENPTHASRETNLVLQLILRPELKVELW